MDRRTFLKAATASGLISLGEAACAVAGAVKATPFARVRPGDAAWPSQARWNGLFNAVGGRLIKLDDPLASCRAAPDGVACQSFFKEMRNPYFISDNPALTETSGWVDAWTSKPSTYAVKAQSTADVVAAVNFARENNLRLVIKGGGHSYQGTSDAPDSLLIWTREMSGITLHDAFVPVGCDATHAPQPAVTSRPERAGSPSTTRSRPEVDAMCRAAAARLWALQGSFIVADLAAFPRSTGKAPPVSCRRKSSRQMAASS
jgi:hypothetical protein